MRTVYVFLSLSVAAMLAAPAFSQAPGVDNGRVSRHCTGATLNTDPAAPCADDVLRDRPEAPAVRAPSEPLPTGAQGATSTQPLPRAPNTSVGTTPGTPTTSVGSTPGSPTTSGGTTPGVGPTSVAPPGSAARTTNRAAR